MNALQEFLAHPKLWHVKELTSAQLDGKGARLTGVVGYARSEGGVMAEGPGGESFFLVASLYYETEWPEKLAYAEVASNPHLFSDQELLKAVYAFGVTYVPQVSPPDGWSLHALEEDEHLEVLNAAKNASPLAEG